jgi:hypothetical protein
MTAGFSTDSTDDAIQSDIVAVGYGAPTGRSEMLTPGSEISLQATTACCTGDYVRNQNGAAVIAPITSGSATQPGSSAAASPTTHASPLSRETIRAISCGIRTLLCIWSRSTAPL